MKTKINTAGLDKQIYLDNRNSMIMQFRASLAEPKTKFITWSVFICIYTQEEFVEHVAKNQHQLTTIKEEKETLNLLVRDAKEAYGKEYERLYQELRKERNK